MTDSHLVLHSTHCMICQVREMLTWAKKARCFAKVGLVLASIALRVCTSIAIPTTDFEAALGTKAGGALSEFVEEALTSGVEATASVTGEGLEGGGPAEGLHLRGAGPGIQQVSHSSASGCVGVFRNFRVLNLCGCSLNPCPVMSDLLVGKC